jgi:hypothetical protein
MKNQYRKIGNDESYTYPTLVYPLLKFIEEFKKHNSKKDLKIWCPFSVKTDDTLSGFYRSAYVDVFEKYGYSVIASHISENKDFFIYEPKEEYDIIIDNPPFSGKKEIFSRAIELNKPFCLLAPIIWLNDATPNKIFNDDKLQLIIPNKRANFYNHNKENLGKTKQISFKSAYYCYDFLIDKQIAFINYDGDFFKQEATLF